MACSRRLWNAFNRYEVNYREYLRKAKILDGTAGKVREEMQNRLAEWIETTFPLRLKKPAGRVFAASEKRAVDVVFSDALQTALKRAGRDYTALEYVKTASLYRTNLDVGYIREPEESDYRKLASWRLAYIYVDAPDEEILEEWCKNYEGWEILCRAIEKERPLRIWYSENPRELCGFWYLCSLLQNYPADVYAVRAPERIHNEKDDSYRFVFSTGDIDPDSAGRLAETAVKLSPKEIRMYAKEWSRLKQENALLRTVTAGRVVSADESFYDDAIWKHVSEEPKKEAKIFEEVMIATPWIQQGWITLRIQKMIDKGRIVIAEDNENPAGRLLCRKQRRRPGR